MLNNGTFIADRYEIVGQVGTGGMSDVYKAKDHTLGRYVAIKVLKSEFSEDTNFVSKFRTEAQSAAVLEHPNIVNIYDVGSENGIHYIVMEKRSADLQRSAEHRHSGGTWYSGSPCKKYRTSGYQTAEYHHFHRWKSKSNRFWYCKSCIRKYHSF